MFQGHGRRPSLVVGFGGYEHAPPTALMREVCHKEGSCTIDSFQ